MNGLNLHSKVVSLCAQLIYHYLFLANLLHFLCALIANSIHLFVVVDAFLVATVFSVIGDDQEIAQFVLYLGHLLLKLCLSVASASLLNLLDILGRDQIVTDVHFGKFLILSQQFTECLH